MPVFDTLLETDVLVFSSHKTMTQTLKNSLNCGGIRTKHCHEVINLGIEPGAFSKHLHARFLESDRKLSIVSVFRDPFERLVSSFFQSLSVDVYGRTGEKRVPLTSPDQSILFTESLEQICRRFRAYCETINGFGESLYCLSAEMRMPITNLRVTDGIGVNGFDQFDLHLFRFDTLSQNIAFHLETIAGRPIPIINSNISSNKWYHEKYAEFKKIVRLPRQDIEKIYEYRKDLIHVFYDHPYDDLVADKIQAYAV